jgi:hypothetical protein
MRECSNNKWGKKQTNNTDKQTKTKYLQPVFKRVLHALKFLLAAHQLAKKTLFFDEAAKNNTVKKTLKKVANAAITFHQCC